MNKIIVSIIIPVFNIQDYLLKCLNSIQVQTYSELQIILVDDGSTDMSGKLCDDFSRMDKRVIVIHGNNEGVVAARIKGIEVATGEYSFCIDGDDWVESDTIEKMLEMALAYDADIVIADRVREYKYGKAEEANSLPEGLYSTSEQKRNFYQSMIYNKGSSRKGNLCYLSGKLIKTSLLKRVALRFDVRVTYGEDSAVIYACFAGADRIFVLHQCLYHYVMREDSSCRKIHTRYFADINEIYIFLKQVFNESLYKEILLRQLDIYFMELVLKGINYFFGLSRDICIPIYSFCKEDISLHSRIILYGAGKVGQSYFQNIQMSGEYVLVAWVDQKYHAYQQFGMHVISPNEIVNLDYDYILLAFDYEDMAKAVKEALLEELKIADDIVIWKKPIHILDQYFKE